MSDSAIAIIGLEVVRCDNGLAPPWRITVDVYEDGEIWRTQLIGESYEKRLRTSTEILETPEITAAFEKLELEAARQIAPIMEKLFRDQVRVKYGDEGVRLLDDEADH